MANQTFEELRRQAESIRVQAPAEIIANPGIGINQYIAELALRGYASESIRTAMWDLHAAETIKVLHPGNLLEVNTPPENIAA